MARRRYPPEVSAVLAAYRREIKRLTAENKALVKQLADVVKVATRPRTTRRT